MASVSQNTSITEFQSFIKSVYSLPNDRHFDVVDMLGHVHRFAMRGLKGIRKEDVKTAKDNCIVSFCWFVSLMNRLNINLEGEVWKRFPKKCSYCAALPCSCKTIKPEVRQTLEIDHFKKPNSLREFQTMFNEIYPSVSRTLDHAGVHFAEEVGELTEVLFDYRSSRSNEDFEKVKIEAADYMSCFMGIFNSLNIDLTQELASRFSNNCHICNKLPCECNYAFIKKFKF